MATMVSYDREAAVREFEDTKAGVKGLLDAGITALPAIFRHPTPVSSAARCDLTIPSIDLSLPDHLLPALIRSAAADWGFFQLTNHGVPPAVISAALAAVRAFHELPSPDRAAYYSRATGGVSYYSNLDLFRSAAASWCDTLSVTISGPNPVDPGRIPDACRAELLAWDEHGTALARRLMGLLSVGIGLEAERLEELSFLEARIMVCNYYPWCPEPEATTGLTAHTDPGVLTLLVQDSVGGLQVKGKGGDGEECWVDVKPLPGAIVVNVGDILQIISNDEYTSVEHRVVANSYHEARVSIAMFFNPNKRGEADLYGPLPELVSPEKPAHYRNFSMSEFLKSFFSKELDSKSSPNLFKLV